MQKFKGFTLIELMIVVTILGILIAIAVPAYSDHKQGIREKDYRCIAGYKFIRRGGNPNQILDNEGHGIPCS